MTVHPARCVRQCRGTAPVSPCGACGPRPGAWERCRVQGAGPGPPPCPPELRLGREVGGCADSGLSCRCSQQDAGVLALAGAGQPRRTAAFVAVAPGVAHAWCLARTVRLSPDPPGLPRETELCLPSAGRPCPSRNSTCPAGARPGRSSSCAFPRGFPLTSGSRDAKLLVTIGREAPRRRPRPVGPRGWRRPAGSR